MRDEAVLSREGIDEPLVLSAVRGPSNGSIATRTAETPAFAILLAGIGG